MDYFWSPDAVRGCLGCLMKVLSDATNSFIYLHYNSMELGPLRAGGGAKRPLLRVCDIVAKNPACLDDDDAAAAAAAAATQFGL